MVVQAGILTGLLNAGFGISGSPSFATIGTPYSFTPTTSGGVAPITYAYTGTTLSTYGLSFNVATGAITGTVTGSAGTISGTITATDSTTPTPKTATLPVSIGVYAALGPATASFQTSASAGSTITTITGLSSGETVASVSPNDGRIAVTSGGTVTVGLTASSAGRISYTFTTSAGRTLTIAVTASAQPALQPTVLATDGTAHYHINTATLTFLGGTANFTFSGSTATVTIAAGGTGAAIVKGMVFTGPTIGEGARVLSIGTYTQAGGGTITLNYAPITAQSNAAGSASGASVVVGVSDGRGNAPLVSTDGMGPLLVTYGDGTKALRFETTANQSGSTWLSATGLTGLSSQNFSVLMAGRLLSVYNPVLMALTPAGLGNGAVLRVRGGSYENGNGPIVPTPLIDGKDALVQTLSAANRFKMLVGANLDIWGASSVQTTGVNVAARHYANGNVVSATGATSAATAQTGFVFSANGTGRCEFDMTEAVVWYNGEVTSANQATAVDGAFTAMRTNWNADTFTNQLIFGPADSRSIENYYNGKSFGSILSEPGHAMQIPRGTRVVIPAYAGGTIQNFEEAMQDPLGLFSTSYMFGGGNDRFFSLLGVNEMTTTGNVWPSTNTTAGTNDRADEVWGAAGAFSMSAVVDGYANTSYQVTITNVQSGTVKVGQVLEGFNATGSRITAFVSGTSGGAGVYSVSKAISGGSSGTPLTGITSRWTTDSYAWQRLLDRGYKGIIAIDLNTSIGSTAAIARERLRNYQRAAATTLTGATGKLQFADLPLITAGGLKVFGDDGTGPSLYWRDNLTHPTDLGRLRLLDGADTPQYGIRPAVMASLAS